MTPLPENPFIETSQHQFIVTCSVTYSIDFKLLLQSVEIRINPLPVSPCIDTSQDSCIVTCSATYWTDFRLWLSTHYNQPHVPQVFVCLPQLSVCLASFHASKAYCRFHILTALWQMNQVVAPTTAGQLL